MWLRIHIEQGKIIIPAFPRLAQHCVICWRIKGLSGTSGLNLIVVREILMETNAI